MGLKYNLYLDGNKIYGCQSCKTHLADHEEILSRVSTLTPPCPLSLLHARHQPLEQSRQESSRLTTEHNPPQQNFRGQHGKAYLFNKVVNVLNSEPSERNMTTGRHVVRDITCGGCGEVVGWKYDKAYEPSEKYKEGKFILEAELLINVT